MNDFKIGDEVICFHNGFNNLLYGKIAKIIDYDNNVCLIKFNDSIDRRSALRAGFIEYDNSITIHKKHLLKKNEGYIKLIIE